MIDIYYTRSLQYCMLIDHLHSGIGLYGVRPTAKVRFSSVLPTTKVQLSSVLLTTKVQLSSVMLTTKVQLSSVLPTTKVQLSSVLLIAKVQLSSVLLTTGVEYCSIDLQYVYCTHYCYFKLTLQARGGIEYVHTFIL